jgi:hypothetical protein
MLAMMESSCMKGRFYALGNRRMGCAARACGKAGEMRLAGNAEKERFLDRKTAFLRQKGAFFG